MPFMRRQITGLQTWLEVETTHGTEWLPAGDLGLFVRDSEQLAQPLTTDVRIAYANAIRWLYGLHRVGCLRHNAGGRRLPRRNVS
jgi:hypothetical protein